MNPKRLETINKRKEIEFTKVSRRKHRGFSKVDFLAHAFFRMTGLWNRGKRNALDVKIKPVEFSFSNLPEYFDETRILFISDLHISGLENLSEKICDLVETIDYDFAILGGDYCHGVGNDIEIVKERISPLINILLRKSNVYAVLGNHDTLEVADFLDSLGAKTLINESVTIKNDCDSISLVGLDDCHFYGTDNFELGEEEIQEDDFKILICHSPEIFEQAAKKGYDLYLAGHTHGGQICLPGEIAVITNAEVPRAMIKGKWQHRQLQGYTSLGAGVAKTPLRFNCPAEICLITLKRQSN